MSSSHDQKRLQMRPIKQTKIWLYPKSKLDANFIVRQIPMKTTRNIQQYTLIDFIHLTPIPRISHQLESQEKLFELPLPSISMERSKKKKTAPMTMMIPSFPNKRKLLPRKGTIPENKTPNLVPHPQLYSSPRAPRYNSNPPTSPSIFRRILWSTRVARNPGIFS